MSRSWHVSVLTIALAGALPSLGHGQATGSVRGRVIDAASGQAVRDAKVEIVGSALRARTDESGDYVLRRVPEGESNIRIAHHGYVGSVERIPVVARNTTTADFALIPLRLLLDTIPVIGERDRRRASTPGSDSLPAADGARVRQPADLFAGNVAGATILRSGGQIGSGTRIRFRGTNSFTLAGDPLVYVDGIRVANNSGRGPNIWDLLDPETIDRIEILRGAAAATLYGLGATNGVILIYTKQAAAPK